MNFFRRRKNSKSNNNNHVGAIGGGISNPSSNRTKHQTPNYNFNNNNNSEHIHHHSLNSESKSNDNHNQDDQNGDHQNGDHQNDTKKPNKFLSSPQHRRSSAGKSTSTNPNNNIIITSATDDNDNNNDKNKRKLSKHKKKRSSIFHSKSMSNSSIGISARSMVSISNSALSLLDYNIERTDIESACCTLMDLTFDIRAIWIVARPIDRASMATRKFQHWCVKIHAAPALISMDFFESGGKGAFGISSVCASWTELEDFLHYHYTDYESQKQIKKPWKILSCVVPRKYDKITNLEKHQLPLEIGKDAMGNNNNNNNNNNDDKNGINKIKCEYKVRDLGEFIEEWVEDHKSYNSVATNCQRFAYDVYNFLIGDNYQQKVKLLDKHFQSPYDRQKEKLNRLKNNQDPNLNENETSDTDNNDNDQNKNNNDCKEIEDESENMNNNNQSYPVNNPKASVLVESLDETTLNFMDEIAQKSKKECDTEDID